MIQKIENELVRQTEEIPLPPPPSPAVSTPEPEMMITTSFGFQQIMELQGKITEVALFMEGKNIELQNQMDNEINQIKKESCINEHFMEMKQKR